MFMLLLQAEVRGNNMPVITELGNKQYIGFGHTNGDGMALNASSAYVWFDNSYYHDDEDSDLPGLCLIIGEGSFVSDNRVLGLRHIRRRSFSSWQYGQCTYRTVKNGTTSTWAAHLRSNDYYNSWMNGPGSSYSGNANSLSSNTGETFHFRIWVKNNRRNLTSTVAASDTVTYSQMFSYDINGLPQLTESSMRSRGMSDGEKAVSGIQVFANSGNINIRLASYQIGSKEEN